MVIWKHFQQHLAPYLFVIYTLVWTIICFMIEFSPTFQSDDYWYSYSIFGCCNLSISIIFFVMVGLTTWEKWTFLRIKHSDIIGIGASVFFLRLGAALFSIGAIVLWGIEFFLAFAQSVRPGLCILRTCLYIIFHGAQLIFIFKSQRIVFHCDRLLVFFGLAHTIAVNLWIWVSLCIAKSGISNNNNDVYHITYDRTSGWILHATEPPTVVDIIFERHEKQLRAVKLFGNTAIILLTGNVEFCLIAVGVCLSLFYTVAFNEETHNHRKAHYIGFDYRNTGVSMVLGYIMIILLCLSIASGDILRNSQYDKAAGMIMGIFGLSYYLISIVVCLIVYHCLFAHIVRNQDFVISPNRDAMSHEKTINVIFLMVGASGEVLYCSMGLLGVIRGDSLSDDKGLVLATFVIRAIEVILQALLLFYLLKKGSIIEPCDTIGKQSITFLIIFNMILFGFHTLEGSIRSFGFPAKLDDTSKVFFKISLPLVVFFRFHCAVCFAEIWKIYYHLDPRTRTSSMRSTPNSQPDLSVNTTAHALNSTSTQLSAEALVDSDLLETSNSYTDINQILSTH